jgi:hypothetical protein
MFNTFEILLNSLFLIFVGGLFGFTIISLLGEGLYVLSIISIIGILIYVVGLVNQICTELREDNDEKPS